MEWLLRHLEGQSFKQRCLEEWVRRQIAAEADGKRRTETRMTTEMY